MSTNRTNAGIYWTRRSVFVAAKILLDQMGLEYLERRGYSAEEVRTEAKKIINGSGLLGYASQMEFSERLTALLPDLEEEFSRYSTKERNLGDALVHRARWTLIKNETDRFLTPNWAPFYDMVVESFATGEVIDPLRRYSAHETVVLNGVIGAPGVYVRVDAEATGTTYLGKSSDISKRKHDNSPLFLVRAYITPDGASAAAMEAGLYRKLRETGVVVWEKIHNHKPGLFKVERGVNVVGILDELVRRDYREFCRAALGWL